jgi:hypothetical protein
MTEHEETQSDIDRAEREAEERRPVEEAGGGESEGFEEAERELVENASHESDTTPDPTHLAGEPEESEPDVEYGDADEVQSDAD